MMQSQFVFAIWLTSDLDSKFSIVSRNLFPVSCSFLGVLTKEFTACEFMVFDFSWLTVSNASSFASTSLSEPVSPAGRIAHSNAKLLRKY